MGRTLPRDCGDNRGWAGLGWSRGGWSGSAGAGQSQYRGRPAPGRDRDILNSKIKRREMFRPFAPSILEDAAADYFMQSYPSPFMLMAYPVRPEKRAVIPATTHVDGTGRLQTVNARQNPLYHKLIREFGRQTGVPVLLNTSFNENEPVVCRPRRGARLFSQNENGPAGNGTVHHSPWRRELAIVAGRKMRIIIPITSSHEAGLVLHTKHRSCS